MYTWIIKGESKSNQITSSMITPGNEGDHSCFQSEQSSGPVWHTSIALVLAEIEHGDPQATHSCMQWPISSRQTLFAQNHQPICSTFRPAPSLQKAQPNCHVILPGNMLRDTRMMAPQWHCHGMHGST